MPDPLDDQRAALHRRLTELTSRYRAARRLGPRDEAQRLEAELTEIRRQLAALDTRGGA